MGISELLLFFLINPFMVCGSSLLKTIIPYNIHEILKAIIHPDNAYKKHTSIISPTIDIPE